MATGSAPVGPTAAVARATSGAAAVLPPVSPVVALACVPPVAPPEVRALCARAFRCRRSRRSLASAFFGFRSWCSDDVAAGTFGWSSCGRSRHREGGRGRRRQYGGRQRVRAPLVLLDLDGRWREHRGRRGRRGDERVIERELKGFRRCGEAHACPDQHRLCRALARELEPCPRPLLGVARVCSSLPCSSRFLDASARRIPRARAAVARPAQFTDPGELRSGITVSIATFTVVSAPVRDTDTSTAFPAGSTRRP